MLQIAGNVGQKAFEPQEFLPEIERLAVWRSLATVGLDVGLGFEHLFLADALEVAFQTFTVLRHVEQRGHNLRQTLGTLNRQ